MDVVVVSPDFPQININLCEHLAQAGIRTLGIGDAVFDDLDIRLKESLTEYYRVDTLDNYDQVYRGTAFFAHKYGKPEIIESNNAHWLEMDAQLRTDFNVAVGPRSLVSDADSLTLLASHGIATGPGEGTLLSVEALVDDDGVPIFLGATKWPSESSLDYTYRTTTLPDHLRSLALEALRILDARTTFVHMQVYVDTMTVLRVTRSAAPAFTLDMHNYAWQTDIYQQYASLLASHDPNLQPVELPTPVRGDICVYASRRDDGSYTHSAQAIEEAWSDQLRHVGRNPVQYRHGMGDTYYLAVVGTEDEADLFAAEVTERE